MQTPSWLWLTQLGARLVLVILAGLSVASVAVILDRRKAFKLEAGPGELDPAKKAIKEGRIAELEKLAASTTVLGGYLALLGSSLSRTSHPSGTVVDRATRSYLATHRARLEKGMTWLATVGSNAPFIGLFGTVLGIIQAFGELSSSQGQQGGTGSVMAAISEALVATAVGLLVAIPAVIAFNIFQKRIKEILVPCEILRDEFVAKMESQTGSQALSKDHGR